MDKIEYMMTSKTKDRRNSLIECNFQNFDCLFRESENKFKDDVREAIKICKNNMRPKTFLETQFEEEANNVLVRFGKEKLHEEVEDSSDILSQFIFFGLSGALKNSKLTSVCHMKRRLLL